MQDMTTGSISRQMLRFTVPLLLSNLFQQFYNVADTVIVGRLLGKQALAAVGSAGAVMNILMFMIVGISLGSSVLLAQYYGAQNEQLVRKELGTAVTAGLLATGILIVLAMLCIRPLLRLMQTPGQVLIFAAEYLYITTLGLLLTFLYNICAASLRAVGDAKAPTLFLIPCFFLNLMLDVLFIRYFHMGVRGAALATVISQGLAALLCILHIVKRVPLLRLAPRELRIDPELLQATLRYSGLYAIQQCILYVGVLLVQRTVNTLGIDAMAAYSAVTKIDNFALMPGDSLASALSTFVAQNNGAKKEKRILSSLRTAMAIGICFSCLLTLLLPYAAYWLMELFLGTGNPETTDQGVAYLKLMVCLYPLTAICNAFQGFFRGLGRLRVTLNATIVQIPIRVLLAVLLAGSFRLLAIPLATGTGWICMAGYAFYEYRRYRKQAALQNT